MCGYLACYEPGPTPSTTGCADVRRIVTIVVCYWADNGSTIIEDPKYMQNLVSDCIRNSKRFIGNVNNAIYDQLGTDAAELFRQSAGKPMSHGCGKTQTLLTSCSKQ